MIKSILKRFFELLCFLFWGAWAVALYNGDV